MEKKKIIDIIVKVVTIILSVFFIFFANKIVSKDLNIFQNEVKTDIIAKVTDVKSREEQTYSYDEINQLTDVTVIFEAKIIKGDDKGKTVEVIQTNSDTMGFKLKEVEKGDKVLIYQDFMNEQADWTLINYYRTNGIIILGAIFVFMIMIVCRKRGLNIIVSLAITCAVIFCVFVPSILTGYNIYVTSLIICLFVIISTLLILNGYSRKTLATTIGCFSGVIIAGVISIIMDKVLMLTGIVDEHSIYLTLMNTANPINLKAIIFASIIIGSLGAVMDVAMDISSSLYEVSQHVEGISFKELVKSGTAIGHDIMGTMSNTLVLAYIGSSLSSILLLLSYSSSFVELFNKEQIIVELLQALIGSMGILVTIPLTTVVCAFLYRKDNIIDMSKINQA